MRLLFTGKGSSGSWEVRGRQLGAACGATVTPRATVAQCGNADLVVAVKRIDEPLAQALRGRRWVWDLVDFYPQPACTGWDRSEAIDWVRGQLRRMQPTAVVWPNARMREDCDPGLPGLVLPHHCRPGLRSNPIRARVRTVGYEGSAQYLGRWRPSIEEQCRRRGWEFRVNPEHLADLDIVIAVRDAPFAGYVQRHWKSNVKLANAHGSGTPFIGQAECGYVETASGAEYWAEAPEQLEICFNWLEPQSTREQVSDRFRQKTYTLEQAAKDLTAFLDGLF